MVCGHIWTHIPGSRWICVWVVSERQPCCCGFHFQFWRKFLGVPNAKVLCTCCLGSKALQPPRNNPLISQGLLGLGDLRLFISGRFENSQHHILWLCSERRHPNMLEEGKTGRQASREDKAEAREGGSRQRGREETLRPDPAALSVCNPGHLPLRASISSPAERRSGLDHSPGLFEP